MVVKIRDKEIELKYTFNSYRYMRELDVSMMEEIERKPFLMIDFVEQLLVGALNCEPCFKVTEDEVSAYVQSVIENPEGDLMALFNELVEKLEDSDFFKQLQKTAPKQKKKR